MRARNKIPSKNQNQTPDDQFTDHARSRLNLFRLLIVFLFPFMLYSGTINHDYALDDSGVLEQNRFVRQGVSGIPEILTNSYRAGVNVYGDNIYRPFSQVMFALEWEISPGNASLSHFMNVFFYSLSCLLLYLFLIRIMPQIHVSSIFIIVVIFAAHPIHTEVVAYIKSRDEVMSLFFLLIAFLMFFRWLKSLNITYLAIAAVTYFFALISKEGVVTMLAVFPVMGWYFTNASMRNRLAGSLIMVIPAVLYLAIRHWVLSDIPQIYDLSPADNFLVIAPDLAVRTATAIMILGKYLLLLIFPLTLVNDYSYSQIPLVGLTNPWFLISLLVYGSFLYFTIKHFRKKDPLVFGLIFFGVSVSLYSNLLFLIGTSFGERLMFVPSVGFSIALVLVFERLLYAAKNKTSLSLIGISRPNPWFYMIAGIILLFFSVRTITRAAEWKDTQTLVSRDVKNSGNSTRLHLYQGNVYRDMARKESDAVLKDSLTRLSKASYERSLFILPSNEDAMEQLGLALHLLGEPERAMLYFDIVLKKNPMRAHAWNNKGSIYVDGGDYTNALLAFQKAIDANFWYADAWQNAGSVYGRMGAYEKALPYFLKAIELDPERVFNYQLMGLTYENMGMIEEADSWFERAAQLQALQKKK
jgi:Flp pilus assembly protein TadD